MKEKYETGFQTKKIATAEKTVKGAGTFIKGAGPFIKGAGTHSKLNNWTQVMASGLFPRQG
jgi:hypothetical protein